MQSESKKPLLNSNLKVVLVLLFTVVFISLLLFRNLFFQSTYLLKSFGELSIDPEIAFKNNKPCLLYTSPSPRDKRLSRMPSSA